MLPRTLSILCFCCSLLILFLSFFLSFFISFRRPIEGCETFLRWKTRKETHLPAVFCFEFESSVDLDLFFQGLYVLGRYVNDNPDWEAKERLKSAFDNLVLEYLDEYVLDLEGRRKQQQQQGNYEEMSTGFQRTLKSEHKED